MLRLVVRIKKTYTSRNFTTLLDHIYNKPCVKCLLILFLKVQVKLVCQKYYEMTPKINNFFSVVFHIDWLTVENRAHWRHTTHKTNVQYSNAPHTISRYLCEVSFMGGSTLNTSA